MKDIVIVSACRTAIGAFGGSLKDSSAAQLASITMKEAVKPEIDDLYQIKCPRCGEYTIANAIIWNGNKPIEIRFRCQCKKD